MIKHKFQSPKADGTDATFVKPSNWNDDHTYLLDSLRIHSSAGWSWGTTTPIVFPFDALDFNNNAGSFSGGVWTPPANTRWQISVSIFGTILGNAGACEMVMYDHNSQLMAATSWADNPTNFSISLLGSDMYQFGASPPAIQWSGAIGGSCSLSFNGYLTALRFG